MIMKNVVKNYVMSVIEVYGKVLVSQDVRY